MIRKACGQDSVTTGFVSYVVWDGGKSSTWVAWRNNFDGEGVRVDEFETAEAAMVATDDCLSDGSSA